MAVQSLSTIKNWFKTRLKPTQAQFWDTWDSFWHKNDAIPVNSIEDLSSILNSKASQEGVNNALEVIDNAIADLALNKVDLIEGKELSDENYTLEEKSKLAGLDIRCGEEVKSGSLSYSIQFSNTLADINYNVVSGLKILKTTGEDVGFIGNPNKRTDGFDVMVSTVDEITIHYQIIKRQ